MNRDLKNAKFKVYSITKKQKITDLTGLIYFIKEEFEKINDYELLVLIDKMIDWKKGDSDLDFFSGHFCISDYDICELWDSRPFLNFFDLDKDPEEKDSISVCANLEIFECEKYYFIIIKPFLEKRTGLWVDNDINFPITKFFYNNLIFKKLKKKIYI